MAINLNFYNSWVTWRNSILARGKPSTDRYYCSTLLDGTSDGSVIGGQSTKTNLKTISLPFLLQPLWIRVGTSDEDVFDQIFIWGSYDLEATTFAISVPATIVDVGANIGLSCIFLSSLFPHSRLIALEPEVNNFNCLNLNVRSYTQIETIRVALWKHSRGVSIADPSAEPFAYQVTETFDSSPLVSSITVPGLIEACGLSRIDLLKLDIEGAEKEIFSSLSSYNWLSLIRILVVEFHDRILEGCSSSLTPYLGDLSFAHARLNDNDVYSFRSLNE